MKHYKISNKDAKLLEKIAGSSDFESSEDVLSYLIKKHGSKLIKPAQRVIDLQPIGDGVHKTQEEWIKFYNSEVRMISAPDVIGASKYASPEALEILKKECTDSFIITSTHISYKPKTLAGVVTHHYQSTVVNPKIISLDEIPVFWGESVKKVVKTKEGLLYLRALADDRYAKPNELLEMLVKLSKMEPKDIHLCTSQESSREEAYPGRAVAFGFGRDHGFSIDGASCLKYMSGHSCGVLISPRSGRNKK